VKEAKSRKVSEGNLAQGTEFGVHKTNIAFAYYGPDQDADWAKSH
jgi:hypothetical protein